MPCLKKSKWHYSTLNNKVNILIHINLLYKNKNLLLNLVVCAEKYRIKFNINSI